MKPEGTPRYMLSMLGNHVCVYSDPVTHYFGEQQACEAILAFADLVAAMKGLEYPDEPGRYCDHAAEPCRRCEAVRAALAKARG